MHSDGQIDRLGFYTDERYDPVTGMSGDQTISATQDFPIDLTGEVEEVHETIEDDAFQAGEMDTDRNDEICWDDRRAVIAAIGLSIGDEGYNPRADLDLDGTVEMSDYIAYVATFNSAACAADFNCSGSVTAQDIYDFNAAYFGNTLEGDFNGSGSVSAQDIFDFLAAYFTGCP